LESNNSYLKNFDALGAMLGRGRSFSGRERNCCFLNTGGDRFSDVSAATGLDFVDDGRSVATVDWDHDGDLDLWITNRTSPGLRFVKNDMPSSQHFLALKLEGTTSNRDAVGARVELHLKGDAGTSKRIKTLHAGDGFQSQSSKWLHFGLGRAAGIERVDVRWPGSQQAESFTTIELDRRYRIVQGTGEAVAVDSAPREIKLGPSPPNLPPETGHARLALTHRMPLSDFAYLDDRGLQQSLGPPAGRATLINLWASWCTPCLEELSELAASEEQLRERGLEVLALSTDGLTSDTTGEVGTRSASTAVDAQPTNAFLDRVKWPFASGVATEEAALALTVLHNQTVYHERPLPLPSSFLVDAEQNVAVIYKGPVTVKQLLDDLEWLQGTPRQIAEGSFPFPGRVATSLFPLDELAFARAFLEGGYLDEARGELIKYIRKSAELLSDDDPQRAARARQKLAEAFHLLATLERQFGRLDAAVAAFRQVVKLDPNQPAPRVSLALALWDNNDQQAAREQLDEILRLGPNNPQILNLLGHTHTQWGESDRAAEFHQRALDQEPDSDVVRLNLAIALQTSGQAEEAVGHYRKVLRRQPKTINAANNLAWILATNHDEKLRDAPEALRLATEVSKMTGGRQPSVLDTLAASLAASGRFDDAVTVAEKAIQLAREQEQAELAEKIQSRLLLYQEGKPYREGFGM
jgi:tetratricopeptide (TPR) repeat protein/thiol-disulfide isomerase/thioredoxin